MRIAMVSEHASPLAAVGGVDSGGQNVHVESLARAVARAGHDVTVYTRRDSAELPDRVRTADGVLVEHLDAGPAAPVPRDELLPFVGQLGSELAARFAADPPDLVHAHFWMSGLAALSATRDLDVPVVQTFHALGVTKRRFQGRHDTSPPVRIRMERALARDVDRIVATCTDEVGELVRLGAARNRITVVPSGVDIDQFSPDGPAAERGDRPRVLCIGRLVPRKGFDTVLRALVGVPEAELIIAGGPAADELAGDPEAARLTRLAERFGVADRVRLVGAVARPDVPALLRSADLVVCTPWYEPFGIVPLEAMACGVPVVASAVGGFLDTVVDGATGTLVPPRRPDRLAAAMRRLLAEPFWREAYGTAGVDRARSRYSWDRIAAATLAVYADLLGLGAAPAASDDEDELETAAGNSA
ncbi:MAG TPA: glycosyltransferase [Mycobacteriales bacterium]|nr:glycosyltransferase [Mycobacteriales bacterium]